MISPGCGTPTTANSYTVSLSATNGGGVGTGTLTITTVSVYQGPGDILAVTPSDGAANQPLSVTLNWSASNPGGGALRYDVYVVQATTDIYFPNNLVSQGQTATSFTVSNLPYNTPVSWGIKAIDNATGSVRYSKMFHFSTAAYTTPSTGSVSINAGAATTTSYSVMLNTTVNAPANGVRQYMRFSNDGITYGWWQNVSSMYPWNLADPNYGGKAGLTTYKVYAQFQDDQGNISPVYTDTIDKVAGTAGNIILNGKFYETIQDAINAANPGETVYLTEGVFTIPSYMSTPNSLRPHDPNTVVGMVLRPGVALKGAGANKTTIIFQNAFYGLVDANNATIEGINLENNSTYGMRATVLLESTSSKIHNCTIRGGYNGISVGFSSLRPATNNQISNNLIISNTQGIFVTPNATNISIDNNSIAYNAYWGASIQNGSTTTLRNNIMAFNGYAGIAAWATTSITMANNDVFPNVAGAGYNSGITDKTGINGNISADPLFVNVSAVNYQLSSGSPAVNTGANIGVPFNGSAPDMGAFEQNATGSIQLNTNQPGASFVIADQQVSGTTWSGTNLPIGIYTISFSALPNLYSPAYQTVELLSGQALVVTANYLPDTTTPVGSIAVNFEEYATDDANASLVLDVLDAVAGMGSGAQMKFSNDGLTWSIPEPYSTLKKGWNLAAGYGATNTSGLKTVYAMVSDALGNWATFSDAILYVPNRQVLNVPAQYSTIQAAVNAALPGDVVQIAPGTFCENVTLLNGVTLRGSGGEKTLFNCLSRINTAPNSQIEGVGGYISFNASAGPTIIQGNITSAGGQQVVVTGAGRRIIRNNIFHPVSATPYGIGVIVSGSLGAEDVVVENNSFVNLSAALQLDTAQPVTKVSNRNNIFVSNNIGVIDSNTSDTAHKHIFSSFNTYWGNIKGNFGELDAYYVTANRYQLMEAGDINADPLFTNVLTADYHLQAPSTSINSGNPDARYADVDLSRNDRGAYGGQRAAINSAPSFVTEPQSQFVTIGTNITLGARATGSLPLAYQWSKDGIAITAATSPTLTLNNVGINNVGVYTVTVTNQLGSVTSGPAYVAPNSSGVVPNYLLNVTAATSGLVSAYPALTNYPEGSFVTLTAANRPGYQFVSWGGDVAGVGNQLAIIINGNKNIIAHYQVAVSLSTTALVFATRGIGNPSAAQAVTLTNSGLTTLNLASITPSGDFGQSNNCGTTLAAGANCIISVTFTPTAVGVRSGAITIISDAASSHDTISLSGTGKASVRRDFNGDGKSDILWRGPAGEVAVWLMNGSALQSSGVAGTIPANWQLAGTGDFNGDGRADIVRRGPNGEVAIWIMNGSVIQSSGSVTTVPLGWNIASTDDFNGDGKADLLWRGPAGEVAVWLMNGSTIQSSSIVSTLPAAWVIAESGDFNGDGKADILWHNTVSGENSVWLMNGAALLSSAYLNTLNTPWLIAGTGDFNGDGKTDILWRNTTTGENAVWVMNGASISSSGYLNTLAVTWSVSAVGDYNGDGKADILWRNAATGENAIWLINGLSVSSSAYLNVVPASWAVAAQSQTGAAPVASLSAASLSFAAQHTGTTSAAQLVTLSNTGSAVLNIASITASAEYASTTTCGATLAVGANCTFSVSFTPLASGLRNGAVTVTSNASAASVTLSGTGKASVSSDFNGDSNSDILLRNAGTGQNVIWLMNGTTMSSSGYLNSVAAPWNIAANGDFDGDGKADILWRDPVSGNDAIWFMNGTTQTSGGYTLTVAAPWNIIGAADFDGDGKADLLWRDATSGANAVWLMNGLTQRSGASLSGIAAPWALAALADFNGDGKADILWRNPVSGQNALWLMNGTAMLSSTAVSTLAAPWSIAGTGDFDGDGKADILWRNTVTGQNAVWYMNGAVQTSGAYLNSVPVNWNVEKVADYNGDGKADILWRDSVSGMTAVWLMNGAVLNSSGVVTSSLPAAWGVAK